LLAYLLMLRACWCCGAG